MQTKTALIDVITQDLMDRVPVNKLPSRLRKDLHVAISEARGSYLTSNFKSTKN